MALMTKEFTRMNRAQSVAIYARVSTNDRVRRQEARRC
jgi:hypothetical protein